MSALQEEIFVCLDCETTGLEPATDRIIEVAVAKFQNGKILEQFSTLVDPEGPIPEESTAIHHITSEMVAGQPKIGELLPKILQLLGDKIVVGHGILFDLRFLAEACQKRGIPNNLLSRPHIDTLRLARLYGESPVNSLERLRQHFNIPDEGAHRAMSDVMVNILVFHQLAKKFKSSREILERLQKPIALKLMPLGKHKGRPFSELPLEYLVWASKKDFDQDLLFSLRSEIKRRRKGLQFDQATSPFSEL